MYIYIYIKIIYRYLNLIRSIKKTWSPGLHAEATSCAELQRAAQASVQEAQALNTKLGWESRSLGQKAPWNVLKYLIDIYIYIWGSALGTLMSQKKYEKIKYSFVGCCFSLEAHGGHLSDLTSRMARLGCSGKYPGNIERDLCTLLEIPIQSIWLEIPVRCEKNRKDIELKKLPVICPHLLYEYLHVS